MKEKVVFLSGLNGLRAIAAIAVVISHTTLAMKYFGLSFTLFGTNDDGTPKGYLLASYGVTIFFVLSGFLITYLLLLEKNKKEINVKAFYIRRILRIWPLYYLYLALVLVTVYFVKDSSVSLNSLLYYIFFTANIPFIFNFALPFLDHLWSIGVEEQFYLFWPWIIKKTKSNLLTILISIIVILNVIRVLLWYFYPGSFSAVFSIVNRFDCMIIGGVGAILYYNNNSKFIKIFDNKITQSIAILILFLLIINKFHTNAIVDTFIIAIVSLQLIIGQINIKNRIINLNHSIFDFFGKISFGIYIYHPLIIFYLSRYLDLSSFDESSKYLVVYFSVLAVTILVAYTSYTLFELRFIKLKNKFAVVKSKSSKL